MELIELYQLQTEKAIRELRQIPLRVGRMCKNPLQETEMP